MPTVPRYAAEELFPTVDAFPHQATSALGQFTGQLADYMKKQEEEDKIRATRDADAQLGLAHQILLYGQDGTGGYNALKGQAAVDQFPILMNELEQVQKEIEEQNRGTLDDNIFADSANRRNESFRSSAFQKVAQAKQQADADLANMRIGLITNDVLSNKNRLNDSLDGLEAEILYVNKLRGQGPSSPQVQLQLMQARGQMMRKLVNQAVLDGDTNFIAALLERMEPGGDATVDPDTYSELKEVYTKKTIDQQANALVEYAQSQYGNDYKAARKFIREEAKGTVGIAAVDKLLKSYKEDGTVENIAWSRFQRNLTLQEATQAREQKEQALTIVSDIAEGTVSSWDDLVQKYGIGVMSLDYKHQNQIENVLGRFNEDIQHPTDEGRRIYAEVMTNPDTRELIEPEVLYKLGEELPQSMVRDIARTIQSDQRGEGSEGRRGFDKIFRAKMDASGLSGEDYTAVRGSLAESVYGEVRDRGLKWTDQAELDKILDTAFNAGNLHSLLNENVSAVPASETVRTRIADLIKTYEIEDPDAQGKFSTMFSESVDKMFKGKPTATDLDNLTRMMTEDEFTVPGWFNFKTQKPVFEIYNSMNNKEISHSRNELIQAGFQSPTRVQIALNHSQNLTEAFGGMTEADRKRAVKSLKERGIDNPLAIDAAIEHLRIKDE